MSKIFVTGGAGYVGNVLVPQLLEYGHDVTVYDMFYFDDFLDNHENLEKIKGDIRDYKLIGKSITNHDIFINLACISNDASFELNENLSTSINLDAFEPMVKTAKENKIQKFIYASSSSVYGISNRPNVKEDHPLVPLTLYNKYKGMCEPILLKYADENFCPVIFRPATVCGYSPRMRLDLTVNILTNHAYNNNKIRVFGGDQLRPNIHIQDYCDFVKVLIESEKDKIYKQIFNVGSENMSVLEIAKAVKKIVEKYVNSSSEIEISIEESNDNRSYHINSDKAFEILGFKTNYTIENAVIDICKAFKENKIKNSFDDINYFNVKTIKSLNIK